MAPGTLAFTARLSLVQIERGCLAGALLPAAEFALRVWRRPCFRKRANGLAAADDCLFSPFVVGVAGAEYSRERPARGLDCSGDAGVVDCASQCRSRDAIVQTGGCDRLADGP